MSIIEQIISDFISKSCIYEIRRMWLQSRRNTNFIQLKGDIDLYISSHIKRVADRNVETIVITARKGYKILDEVEVHINNSSEESRRIGNVWTFIRNNIMESEEDRYFCLEDRVEFDNVPAVGRSGFEVYSRRACNVLAQHDIDAPLEED